MFIAYANGPGSFTSLRSAAAFTKAIAASKNTSYSGIKFEGNGMGVKKMGKAILRTSSLVCNVAEKENLYYAAYNLDSNKIDVVTEPTLVTKDFIKRYLIMKTI